MVRNHEAAVDISNEVDSKEVKEKESVVCIAIGISSAEASTAKATYWSIEQVGHACRSFESLITIELSISEIDRLPSGGNAPRSVGVL